MTNPRDDQGAPAKPTPAWLWILGGLGVIILLLVYRDIVVAALGGDTTKPSVEITKAEPSPDHKSDDKSDDERLAAVEAELGHVKQRMADVDGLAARIGKLEAGSPPVDGHGTDAAHASAPAVDLTKIEERLGALEAELAKVQGVAREIAKWPDAEKAQTQRARALALLALARAVADGSPFTLELDLARGAGHDLADDLAPLAPLAPRGLEKREVLAARLVGLVEAAENRGEVLADEADYGERVLAALRNLVVIRPAGPREGIERHAVLSRLHVAAAQGDLALAADLIETLDGGPSVKALRAWRGTYLARGEAERALALAAAHAGAS